MNKNGLWKRGLTATTVMIGVLCAASAARADAVITLTGIARLRIDWQGLWCSSPPPVEVGVRSAVREVISWCAADASLHCALCSQRSS
jgi:hypothetical protein